jgi:hypothetical protein
MDSVMVDFFQLAQEGRLEHGMQFVYDPKLINQDQDTVSETHKQIQQTFCRYANNTPRFRCITRQYLTQHHPEWAKRVEQDEKCSYPVLLDFQPRDEGYEVMIYEVKEPSDLEYYLNPQNEISDELGPPIAEKRMDSSSAESVSYLDGTHTDENDKTQEEQNSRPDSPSYSETFFDAGEPAYPQMVDNDGGEQEEEKPYDLSADAVTAPTQESSEQGQGQYSPDEMAEGGTQPEDAVAESTSPLKTAKKMTEGSTSHSSKRSHQSSSLSSNGPQLNKEIQEIVQLVYDSDTIKNAIHKAYAIHIDGEEDKSSEEQQLLALQLLPSSIPVLFYYLDSDGTCLEHLIQTLCRAVEHAKYEIKKNEAKKNEECYAFHLRDLCVTEFFLLVYNVVCFPTENYVNRLDNMLRNRRGLYGELIRMAKKHNSVVACVQEVTMRCRRFQEMNNHQASKKLSPIERRLRQNYNDSNSFLGALLRAIVTKTTRTYDEKKEQGSSKKGKKHEGSREKQEETSHDGSGSTSGDGSESDSISGSESGSASSGSESGDEESQSNSSPGENVESDGNHIETPYTSTIKGTEENSDDEKRSPSPSSHSGSEAVSRL